MCVTTHIGSRSIAVHRLLEIIFDSRMFVIDLNYGAFFLRYVELCIKYVDVLLAKRSSPYSGFDGFSLGCLLEVCTICEPKRSVG